MNHSLKLALLLPLLVSFGCKSDDDDDRDTDTATGNLEGALGKANRPKTPLSARIDRAGRPAISAALISPFNPADRTADLDRYNRSGNANPTFIPIIEQSLAILDGLDQNCGNQLLAGTNPDQGKYEPLARVLVDDQLYVQSDRPGTPSAYLGVEAEVVGAVPEGGGAGGGRAPAEDVIERSYSVLVAGRLSGIDDNVPSDADDTDIDVFPFLAEP
jgi:hypothetical protein